MACRPQLKRLYRHAYFNQYSFHSKLSLCQRNLGDPHPETILPNNLLKCYFTFKPRCLSGLQEVQIQFCAHFVQLVNSLGCRMGPRFRFGQV